MAGLKDQIEGKAHEIKGRISGDEREELAGKVQQKKGKLQTKVARAKTKAVEQTEAAIDKILE